MSRIKIQLPPVFPFSTTISIRITDLNYGGHVGNDTVLTLFHEARMQFLGSLGYTELNVEGIGLIMSDAVLEFKQEIFYGDKVTAHVAAMDFSRVGFDLYYKLTREGNEILATAKTGMICFDYSRKKVVGLPPAARDKMAAT